MSIENPQDLSVEPSTLGDSNLRTHAIIAYCILLLGMFTGGLLSIVGVIWAYVKRGDSKGTIYESHYNNAISTFWIGVILAIVGILASFIFIGWIILLISVIFCLYRYIKGVIKVMDRKVY